MMFEKYLYQFNLWMKSRAWSSRTIYDYHGYVKKFIEYLNKETEITCLVDIDSKIIIGYQNYIYQYKTKSGKPLSFSSQANRLSALKAFFRFLYDTNMIIYNPAISINLPRRGKKLPKGIMSEKEVMLLLEQPDLNDPIGFRDRTILELLYATGIRNSELRNLAIYDLDLAEAKLTIYQGKHAKDRVLPIGQIAADYLKEYLLTIRPKLACDDNRDIIKRSSKGQGPQEEDQRYLFLSKNGRQITAGNLIWIFEKYSKKAGLCHGHPSSGEKQFTPHSLRHSCATHMLKHGADIRYIQELLGHACIATTQIYTRVEPTNLQEVHRRFHPRERLDDEA
jgi:integrase/recombinase XerD